MRVLIIGAGAVGARAARQLHSTDSVAEVIVADADESRAQAVAASLGDRVRLAPANGAEFAGATVAVLAAGCDHRPLAEAALEQGCHVVSTTDDLDGVRRLLDLDAEARERGLTVAIGAGFSPGLSCVLAKHAASELSSTDEIHVARFGTGGPACARQHHASLGGDAVDWRDGEWDRRPAGSGRELCWFPDPIGGVDCYRSAAPDPILLRPAFPELRRATARVAATRRDRLTARLPMMRPPHAEGAIGALRVEVRGWRGRARDVRVLGVLDRPAIAAGVVAAVTALWAAEGRLARAGAGGLGELVAEPLPFLHALADRGVRAAVFEGTAAGKPSPR